MAAEQAAAEQDVTITKEPGGNFGMRISPAAIVTDYTEPGSPAALAGLPIGWKITKVNGVAVSDKPGVVAQLKASADPNTVVFTVTPAPPADALRAPFSSEATSAGMDGGAVAPRGAADGGASDGCRAGAAPGPARYGWGGAASWIGAASWGGAAR